MEISTLKIYYLGKNKPLYLDDYGDILFCEYDQCNQMRLTELANDCDLLLIEIKKENIGKIIKWIFCLHCKEKIPILAIIEGCTTADKLKLIRFGITDYIDEKCNLNEFQDKMNTMLRIVKWKRQRIRQ